VPAGCCRNSTGGEAAFVSEEHVSLLACQEACLSRSDCIGVDFSSTSGICKLHVDLGAISITETGGACIANRCFACSGGVDPPPLPSQSPTIPPSVSPTSAPTPRPTAQPTPAPTQVPTQFPTLSPDPCDGILDLAFLIDASGSVTATDWIASTQFISAFTAAFDVSESRVHVAIASFSEEASVVLTFNDGRSQQVVDNTAATMPQTFFRTFTHRGLDALRTVVFAGGNGVRDVTTVPRLLVVVTDGQSTLPELTPAAAAALRAPPKNVAIHAIGVGSLVNIEELEVIAGSPDRISLLSSFDFTNVTAAVREISSTACTSHATLASGVLDSPGESSAGGPGEPTVSESGRATATTASVVLIVGSVCLVLALVLGLAARKRALRLHRSDRHPRLSDAASVESDVNALAQADMVAHANVNGLDWDDYLLNPPNLVRGNTMTFACQPGTDSPA